MADHKIFKPVSMASLNVDSLVNVVVLEADADNGTFVVLGDATETIFGETEEGCYEAALANAIANVVAVLDGDTNGLADGYDVGLRDPRKAYNKAGTPTRARLLAAGDVFAIEEKAINGIAAAYVIIDATAGEEGKLEFTADVTGAAFYGKVIGGGTIVVGGTYVDDAVLIRVIKNC